jgi:hypothetical protein
MDVHLEEIQTINCDVPNHSFNFLCPFIPFSSIIVEKKYGVVSGQAGIFHANYKHASVVLKVFPVKSASVCKDEVTFIEYT